jgi:phage anti-repressor protein
MAMQLITLHTRSINEQTLNTVNARELHTFLELGRDFSNWIKARIAQYGFEEGEDFILIRQNGRTKNQGGDRRSMNYFITLDMAKELAMGERNEKGKQARRYFIDCEKQLHEQQHLPAATPNTAILESDKYQLLNNIVKSMQLDSDPVVVPSKELIDLIQAVRMYQPQIAQLRTPDWVNDNITRVKDYAQRSFTDF